MNNQKKRIIILVIAIIIVIIIIKLIQNFDSTKNDLKKLGYSKENINLIIEKLSSDQVQSILNLEYNDKLDEIISNDYFIPNNLMPYLEYTKTEDDINKAISKVNVKANKDWYTDITATDLSKGYSILVNKFHYLDTDFKVDDLVNVSNWYAYEGHTIRSEVYDSYVKMWKEANKENLTLLVTSSFRTYKQQEQDYKDYSDDYAARPGHSEHQTGLALDISTYNTIDNDFDKTGEYKWLQQNAHKYGFILRYPENKDDITGYKYESWHYRYLGTALATKVYQSNLTYDEYYAYFCEYKNEC